MNYGGLMKFSKFDDEQRKKKAQNIFQTKVGFGVGKDHIIL